MSNETLRYAVDQVETSPLIDPHFEPAGNRRYYEMYEGLTALGPDGEAGPALATGWEQVAPTRVRFTLRPGARFHDGSPVTGDDVAFSFNRARVPRKSFTVAGRIGTISAVEPVDAHTVDVVTAAPDPLLPKRLAELMVLSLRQLEQAGDDVRPIGSGPYRVVDYDPGRIVRVERWDEHDSRKPPFRTVEVLTLAPEDRQAALRAGDLDLAMIRPAAREALMAAGFQVAQGPITANAGYFLDTVHPDWPTARKAVRQAINLAVNKERMLNELFEGLGEVTSGQFAPEACFGHHPGIKAYPYDPEQARALLARAGFADGFEITIDAVGYSPHDVPKARMVAEDLAAVGIRSNISVINELEPSLQRWFGNTPRGQLSPTGLAIAPAMDVEYALLWFDSTNPTKHHANTVFDELHLASQTELDPSVRLRKLRRLAQILHEDPPFLWLVGEASLYAVRPGLTGFVPRADGNVVPDGLSS